MMYYNCLLTALFASLDRYLLDAKWFNQWKTYVGFDERNSGSVGDHSANPGPVDNSFIMKGMKWVAML